MTTTLGNRKTIRQSIATLIGAHGSWAVAYPYIPKATEVKNKMPFATVVSFGTDQDMAGLNVNDAEYTYNVSSYVLMSSQDGSWTETNAEDLLDDLDQDFRQLIRDNVGTFGGNAVMKFADSKSTTGYIVIGGQDYRYEEYIILVTDFGT